MALPSLYLSDLDRPERTIARFWSYVDKSGECWLWTGCTVTGYGSFRVRIAGHGISLLAHRMAYLLAHGELARDICVLHHCDVRRCVRESHLFLGSRADNLADMRAKGRSREGSNPPRGERHPRARLSVAAVLAIRQAWMQWATANDLAVRDGVTESAIESIVYGHTWRHLTSSS